MQPFQDRSSSRVPGVLIAQGTRWIMGTLGHRRMLVIVSWIGWLLAVALFAVWTLYQYLPPAKPAWVGMTIHTFGFVAWMLVLREWLVIRLRFRDQQPDE
jgi:hypothetical protein